MKSKYTIIGLLLLLLGCHSGSTESTIESDIARTDSIINSDSDSANSVESLPEINETSVTPSEKDVDQKPELSTVTIFCGSTDLAIPTDTVPDDQIAKGTYGIEYNVNTRSFELSTGGFWTYPYSRSLEVEITVTDSNSVQRHLITLVPRSGPRITQNEFFSLRTPEEFKISETTFEAWREGRLNLSIISDLLPEGIFTQTIRNYSECTIDPLIMEITHVEEQLVNQQYLDSAANPVIPHTSPIPKPKNGSF